VTDLHSANIYRFAQFSSPAVSLRAVNACSTSKKFVWSTQSEVDFTTANPFNSLERGLDYLIILTAVRDPVGETELILKVGLVSRLDDQKALEVAGTLAKQLRKRGVTVATELELAKRGRLGGGKNLSDMRVDVIVTVGGDGTVLKTCMTIPEPETPILAVNMGRRGYLTEVEPSKALHAIDLFMRGKYRLEKRAKLAVHLNGTRVVDALNELVVSSGSPSKMLDIELGIDSEQLLRFRGDGMIVSTPTGSTAYALSAGGPVVEPLVDAFVITFICPLAFLRPIVVSMSRSVSIQLVDPQLKALVVADGRFQRELTHDVKLTVRKAEHSSVFVRIRPTPPLGSLMRLQEKERAGL
jgi:NAD+ kinase